MDKSTGDKIAIWFFIIILILLVCIIGLLSWGFIEFVQWLTAK